MKLLFLCTSLAPGRDGVGDYVRQLAAACTRESHTCRLVAVNDRHLPPGEIVDAGHGEIRFPAALPWRRRAEALAQIATAFDPDWVSWQLVPYGFSPKGGIPPEARQLVLAVRRWRQHAMLHELWIGLSRAENFRARLVGTWQRHLLLDFLGCLRPASLHTSNAAYQHTLSRHGWRAELLPLFGNIPLESIDPAEAAAQLAALAGSSLPAEPRCLGVTFGTIHPQWNPAPTFAWLRDAARASGRSFALLALGRAGGHGEAIAHRLQRTFPDLPFLLAGPQPAEKISAILHAADFGLATHPWDLIDKSGSTVTMLEHGLPVLVPRDDWRLRDAPALSDPADPLLRRLTDLAPDAFAAWLQQRRIPAPRLPAVTTQFLNDLGEPVRRCALLT